MRDRLLEHLAKPGGIHPKSQPAAPDRHVPSFAWMASIIAKSLSISVELSIR